MIDAVVIFDANCFKHLVTPSVKARVAASLRLLGLTLWPTVLNALELAKNPNRYARDKRLAIAKEFLEDRPLLPLPDDILRRTGQAVADGSDTFDFGESGFEWLLERPQDITPENVADIEASLQPIEQRLRSAFTNGRRQIQKLMREKGITSDWTSAREYLDEVWYRPSQLHDLIRSEWERFGLPGVAPIDALFANKVWRLHFEGFGAALFGRVIAKREMKQVQAHDFAQLIYLANWRRRVFVTEDQACFDVAEAVLRERHAGARPIKWKDFLDLV